MDTDTNKAKYLANREEMHQACTNFNEAHMALIQNKEDYLSQQMNSWMKSFFEGHRQRQYHRNRQRIMDVRKVIDECREDITSAGEHPDDGEDENGADSFGASGARG